MFRHICTSLLLLSASLCAQNAPLMLGVLEDTPGSSADDPHHRDVRALFYKDGETWKAFPADCTSEACLQKLATDFPRETTWTIAFDGHKFGEAQSRIPLSIDLYSHVGQQLILTTAKSVPTMGVRTHDFEGFLGEPVLRPLVAVSAPNFKDPDLWKPAVVDAATAALVRGAFRRKYPKITDCEAEEVRGYADPDIHVMKAYSAKTGWRLVLTSLKGCDIDDLRGDGLGLEWFTIDPAGSAQFLHGGLVLVDAGDYDNSGHSQLLFMIDDYNRGGYTLYSDDFRKQATFEYSFH
jgi:hypothetical protein